MVSTPEERVAESFNAYFAAFGIRIQTQDVAIGSQQSIADQNSGWLINYRVDADSEGLPTLEFYARNRWTNDRHARIAADGQGVHLEAISEIFFGDDDPADPKSTIKA